MSDAPAAFGEALLSQVEDAALNASAPPQQRWLDGWLLRTQPGKARRARCVHPLAEGRLPLDERLRRTEAVYRAAAVPLVMRLHRFSRPATLDADLAARGWSAVDRTWVMVSTGLPKEPLQDSAPAGLRWQALHAQAYAEAVGELRGSPPEHRQAHAERLHASAVPYRGFAWVDDAGQVQACGQFAREDGFVGLYDVFTRPQARGAGLARLLCERLLFIAANEGATVAYLQVDAANEPARRVYRRLGFADAYDYHYREPPR